MTLMEKLNRVSEIDEMFIKAKGWRSWMTEASKERKGLVQDLRDIHGLNLDHRWPISYGKISA